MLKLQIFYGVWTKDDEMHGSFKAYAQTRELAEEELKKHKDFFCSTPPIPDDKHIVPLNMIVMMSAQVKFKRLLSLIKNQNCNLAKRYMLFILKLMSSTRQNKQEFLKKRRKNLHKK